MRPPLTTQPFDEARGIHWGSDIASFTFNEDGLTLDVALEVNDDGQVLGLKIAFPNATAVRYLDELDLARYWTSERFARGHCVLEVLEGGWSDEENDLQGFLTKRREWLVVTGNGCVSVFSQQEPRIHEHTWHRDA